MDGKQYEKTETDQDPGSSEVNITESENRAPRADLDPGRTPGKAEGVEDPEMHGNE